MNQNVTTDMIRFFLEKGVDPNQKDKDGKDSLHLLCENGRITLDSLNLLLSKGADPNIKENWGKRTCLHLVCENRNTSIDIVRSLLTHKADPNIRCTSNKTALHSVKYFTYYFIYILFYF
jgi:ankyrin repeat protein